MKLSQAFSDRKTKTDIYSKYAARNRCKFVPTLCRLMSPHKESSCIVKCEISKQILDVLGLEAYHVSSFDSQTYDASLSSQVTFLGNHHPSHSWNTLDQQLLAEDTCKVNRSWRIFPELIARPDDLCHCHLDFCGDHLTSSQISRRDIIGEQSGSKGLPIRNESESDVRRWAERSSHSYNLSPAQFNNLNCTIQ